jgi:hypothetical protein
MALILMEGFDYYSGLGTGGGGLQNPSTGWTLDTTSGANLQSGRFDGQAFQSASATPGLMRRFLGLSTDKLCVGLAFYAVNSIAHNRHIMNLRGDGSVKVRLTLTGDSRLAFTTGGSVGSTVAQQDTIGTTLISTDSDIIIANTWNYIEARFVLHETEGTVELWLNGAKLIDETDVNTTGGVIDEYYMIMGRTDVNTTSSRWRIDDLYITDDERIGVRRITTLSPVADTAQKDWDASSGDDNYAMVNEEQPDNDDTYVEATASGDEDLYTLEDLVTKLGYTPQDVDGVQVNVWGRRTDAFTRYLRSRASIGTEDLESDPLTLTETYQISRILIPQNPDTSAVWEVADIGNLEVGMISGEGT